MNIRAKAYGNEADIPGLAFSVLHVVGQCGSFRGLWDGYTRPFLAVAMMGWLV